MSKTKHIHKKLTTTQPYIRKTLEEIISNNKQTTCTIILSRHGMLEWGSNFKETMSVTCRHCNTKDDENHRLNECNNWEHFN